MQKHIFVINGSGGVGKDEFVHMVSNILDEKLGGDWSRVINFSSIQGIKDIATKMGWNGIKDERNRGYLSKLKALADEWTDFTFKEMEKAVKAFEEDTYATDMFIHIREPENIKRAVDAFGARTILVTRAQVQAITSNPSDANVGNFDYDFEIRNDGTLDDLRILAADFVRTAILYR